MYKQSLKTEQDLRSVLSKQKIEAQGLEIDLREVRKENSLLEDAVAHLKNQVARAAAAQIEQAALHRSNSVPTHISGSFSEEPAPAAPNLTADISGFFSEEPAPAAPNPTADISGFFSEEPVPAAPNPTADISGSFSKEPAPTAPNSTANISGFFSEEAKPASREDAAASAVEHGMLPASVDEPASAASDAEIAAWFREQQQASDAVRRQIDVDEHKRLKVELPKLHQVPSRQPSQQCCTNSWCAGDRCVKRRARHSQGGVASAKALAGSRSGEAEGLSRKS